MSNQDCESCPSWGDPTQYDICAFCKEKTMPLPGQTFKSKACADCGQEFTPLSGIAKRCKDCAPKAKKARDKANHAPARGNGKAHAAKPKAPAAGGTVDTYTSPPVTIGADAHISGSLKVFECEKCQIAAIVLHMLREGRLIITT